MRASEVSREILKFCNRTQMFYKRKQHFSENTQPLRDRIQMFFHVKKLCFVSEQFLREHTLCKQKQFLCFSSENISWVTLKFCQQTNILVVNSLWGNAILFCKWTFCNFVISLGMYNFFCKSTVSRGMQKYLQTNKCFANKCFASENKIYPKMQIFSKWTNTKLIGECKHLKRELQLFCKLKQRLQIVLQANVKFLCGSQYELKHNSPKNKWYVLYICQHLTY